MTRLVPVLVLVLLTSAKASGQAKTSADGAIDAAVSRIASPILDRLDADWDAGDATGFAAEFSEDADVINVNGTHFRGRSDIAKQMQSIFNSMFKGSIHRVRNLEMARRLADGVILVVSSGVIDVAAGPLAPRANSRQTFILVNREGAWRIRHWHNTPIRTP